MQVDAGLAAASVQGDPSPRAGPYLAARHERDHGATHLSASGTVTATALGTSGSGALAGSSVFGRGPIGLTLDTEASALSGGRTRASRSLLGGARVHGLLGRSAGLWLHGGGHLAWREAGQMRGGGVDAGGWWSVHGATLSARVQRQWARGQLFADGGRGPVIGVVPVRYTEGALSLAVAPAWGTVQLTAGARRDPDAEQRTEALWNVATTVPVTSQLSVVLDALRQPPDFVHGADGALTLGIGLRFRRAPRDAAPLVLSRATAHLLWDDAGGARLRIEAPGARVVEVMASFTGWEPALLLRGATGFLTAPLPSGAHRLAIRIDGGPWHPPANLPSMDDDFGGRVGMVVVP